MREPISNVRRRRLFRFGTALAMLLALAAYLTVQYVSGGTGTPRCTVVSGRGDGVSYEFTAEQAVNAATISVVGTNRGMPERAVMIALATALQESGLRNIDHGDRDSLGLFQQRPSQGWGTRTQVMDPAYAAGAFYEHLAKVPDYSELPLTVAAQRVQRSGFPDAYAKHEADATLLAAALTGRAAGTLTCEGRPETRPGGPDAVRAALVRDFGRDMFQEADAERKLKTDAGATPSAASADAGGPVSPRTVTVPVPDAPAARSGERQRGWGLAHWAVANASALHIKRVSYAGWAWTAGNTRSEWRADTSGSRNSTGEVRIVTGRQYGSSPVGGIPVRAMSTARTGFRPATHESTGPLGIKGRKDSADSRTGSSLPGFLRSR